MSLQPQKNRNKLQTQRSIIINKNTMSATSECNFQILDSMTECNNSEAVSQLPAETVRKGLALPQPFDLKSHLSSYKMSSGFNGAPMSLNAVMSRKSSLEYGHLSVLLDLERRRKERSLMEPRCTKSLSEIDYGYGPTKPDTRDAFQNEKDMKRRRYQRRNSKTPQMLMAMSASLLDLDFLYEVDQTESPHDDNGRIVVDNSNSSNSNSNSNADDTTRLVVEDPFDDSLAIAEELLAMQQLRKRRKQMRTSKI